MESGTSGAVGAGAVGVVDVGAVGIQTKLVFSAQPGVHLQRSGGVVRVESGDWIWCSSSFQCGA